MLAPSMLRERATDGLTHLRVTSPGLLLGAGLLWTTVQLVRHARHLWFFGDEWTFLFDRSATPSDLLVPHNEHWSTIPLLLYRVLFALFGLDHYLVFALMPIVSHVAVCVALYKVMRAYDVRPWPAALATLVIGLAAGSVAVNLLWAFQVGFLASVFFGLIAIWASRRGLGEPWGLPAVWASLVLGQMSAGMWVPLAVMLGLTVVLLDGFRRALVVFGPPAAVYLVWLIGFGRSNDDAAATTDVREILLFAWAGLSNLWQSVVGLEGTGGVVLLALTIGALVLPGPVTSRALALAGLGSCLALYLLLGVTRASLGQPAASRYAYVGILLTLPALAVVLTWVSDRMMSGVAGESSAAADGGRLEIRGASAVLVGLLAANGWMQLSAYAESRGAASPDLEQRVNGAEALVAEGATLVGTQLDPVYSPGLRLDHFDDPYISDRLPSGRPTLRARLDAAVWLQVGASSDPLGLPMVTDPGIHNAVRTGRSRAGCELLRVIGTAWVSVPASHEGGQVSLILPESEVSVQMRTERSASMTRVIPVTPGTPTHFGSTSAAASLSILLTGRTLLCGGGPSGGSSTAG